MIANNYYRYYAKLFTISKPIALCEMTSIIIPIGQTTSWGSETNLTKLQSGRAAMNLVFSAEIIRLEINMLGEARLSGTCL